MTFSRLYTKKLWLVLPAVLVLLVSPSSVAELEPRCGDCWCIFDGELDDCPSDTTGIADSFPSQFELYTTFEITNADADYLQLQTDDGEECYPFASTLGPVAGYPNSNLPQCAIPESSDSTVCAYLFEPDTPCEGRKYEILTYESVAAAEAAGAVVTHTGACGVCSNANDLWARMNTLDTFEVDTLVCATSYLLNPSTETRFDSLTDCATAAGLSQECAILWSHVGAATVSECASACQANAVTGVSNLNGSPPTCELASCLSCPSSFNLHFNAISGRTLIGSGITERTAKPCSTFTRLVHDPCVGASTALDDGPQYTEAPTPASRADRVGVWQSSGVSFFFFFFGLLLSLVA